MLCVSIKGPTEREIIQQQEQATKWADLVEWRLDLFDRLAIEQLAKLKGSCSLPMIFTCRSVEQGGNFTGDHSTRLALIEQILSLNPDYVDLEYDLHKDFFLRIKELFPSVKIIASYHNFSDSPTNLENIFNHLTTLPADFYKIAIIPSSMTETLKIMKFNRLHREKLIAISMGELGHPSRILGRINGSPFTYCAPDEHTAVAPGQLTANELLNIYHYKSKNQSTRLYGLIGGVVSGSISQLTHNAEMAKKGLNAVYIKMALKENDLQEVLELAKELKFGGLSVTMPYKEMIIPFLDDIDKKAAAIGAVNTIVFTDGKTVGFNTDCLGALNALENHIDVKDKRLIVLGAGGAARAIIYEARERGAHVIILNRTRERACELASQFECEGDGLEALPRICRDGYDIMINTTSSPMPINEDQILPGVVVMDINIRPTLTPFLEAAKKRDCVVVTGYEMFIEQAHFQFKLWFGEGNWFDTINR